MASTSSRACRYPSATLSIRTALLATPSSWSAWAVGCRIRRLSWARVGIDQVVWDTDTKTLHVESNDLLDQHTRYVLIVSKDVRDDDRKIKAAKEFLTFVDEAVTESTGDPDLDAYRAVLRSALTALDSRRIIPKGQVVAASVFTTQSATAVLEKIRDQIHDATPEPADFLLGPNGARTVFNLSEVQSLIWKREMQVNQLSEMTIDLSPLADNVAGVAFGKYLSPDYEVHVVTPGETSEYIPPVETRSGTPAVQGTNEIYFNLLLPSDTAAHPKPISGWPVAIFGPGMGGSKDGRAAAAGNLLNVGSMLAEHGIATIAINAVGHGFGSLSKLTVIPAVGDPVTFSAGGRGIDQDGNLTIQGFEGIVTARRNVPFGYGVVLYSDGFRQTAADLMQLVRVIEVGMDVDGDGQRDLDASRIYYLGASLGGGYGTVFVTIEPDVRVGVFSVPVTPPVVAPLSGPQRPTLGRVLATRQPSLLNAPGITAFNAPAITAGELVPLVAPFLDDNFPLRDQKPLMVRLADADGTTRVIQSPVTNSIAGAMAIRELLDNIEWVGQAGSPIAYAPHLRKAPLPGVAAKSVLFHIAKGDQSAPNPTTTALLRAGELADRTLYYRHDLAFADGFVNPTPTLKNPHGFTVNLNFGGIALEAQKQVAKFFESDGAQIIQPQPSKYFEFPIVLPLPEDLNYIP
jgi:hypothetical protein